MRGRMVTNQLDRMFAGYVMLDNASAPIGSGSSFFAFDTAEFTWLDVAFQRSFEGAAALPQLRHHATDAALDVAGQTPVSANPAKSVSDQPSLSESAASAPQSQASAIDAAPAFSNMANADILPASVMPSSIEFIDFSLYPEFEPANSLLDVIGIGALNGVAQGDSVFLLNESPGFSFVSFDVSETGGLMGGRNAFDPVVYLKGDIDGDGVHDYLIRLDETGPTLMGTDYPI